MLYYINKRLFNLTSQLINKCVPIYVYIFTLIIFRFYNFDAGFSRAPVSPVINQSIMSINYYIVMYIRKAYLIYMFMLLSTYVCMFVCMYVYPYLISYYFELLSNGMLDSPQIFRICS